VWTPGAPRVLVCLGTVCAGVRGGVLLRADQSGSWPGLGSAAVPPPTAARDTKRAIATSMPYAPAQSSLEALYPAGSERASRGWTPGSGPEPRCGCFGRQHPGWRVFIEEVGRVWLVGSAGRRVRCRC
jgi:hypothetical protein